MNDKLVVMDIGDVLVSTLPMAQYRSLARHTAMTWQTVAAAVEGSGIVGGFETGHVSDVEFVGTLGECLGCPDLRHEDVESAWLAVIGSVDPPIAKLAVGLAAAGRLRLASNTNPFHWRMIQPRLAELGITCPVFLSFQIGAAKPSPAFFEALTADSTCVPPGSVFVDDRAEHVNAARRHGLTGWLHRDPNETAKYLANLVH